jgi:hypothetical protein
MRPSIVKKAILLAGQVCLLLPVLDENLTIDLEVAHDNQSRRQFPGLIKGHATLLNN